MSPHKAELSQRTPELAEEAIQRALDQFRDDLHADGQRYSSVREAIARAALTYAGHFEVNDLLAILRERGVKDAHMTTIYRTLPLLVKSKLIDQALLTTGDRQFFERIFERPHHDHLICTACGKVVEFEFEAFAVLERDIANRYGFTLESHFHELLGKCRDCSKKPAKATSHESNRE